MRHSGQARKLEQQHEQLTQKLQAQHKMEMQVRLLTILQKVIGMWASANHRTPHYPVLSSALSPEWHAVRLPHNSNWAELAQNICETAAHDAECFDLIVQEVHAQYRAMLDDTTQQQSSTVKRERDQHAAEREQMQRYESSVHS